jgi:UTP-glucose-1-phosphate uridylyltransferase
MINNGILKRILGELSSSFKIVTNNMINNRATYFGEKNTLTLTEALLKGISTLDQVTNNMINNRTTDLGEKDTLTETLLKGIATLDQVTNNCCKF